MRVSFFFRKPSAYFFSIENLFGTIIPFLRKTEPSLVSLPYKSAASPFALIKNCFYAKARQGRVNHITGEVYYIALALRGKKTILTIHDLESLYSSSKIKNALLKLFWLHLPVRNAAYVTVISEHSKRKLIELTSISDEKIAVIPNCVAFTEKDFKPKNFINIQEPVLLQIGTKPNKNLDNLLQAIEGYSCRLIIVGNLSVDQLKQLRDRKVNFEIYTQLAYVDVINLYYKADIVTFVSQYEGFGMPILEANALGRPVITSTTTAMPEVAGEGALLVDPREPKQIRAAIEKLVTDDTFRTELVKKGYKNVQRFKPVKIAAQYESLYRKIIEESR